RRAVLTRELFERLGGMWIKVGQLLSLRSDVMSPAMVRELGTLQYQARGFPTAIARQVLEAELGSLSRVLAHFDEQPFAAASIAQVHRATLLRNNRAVVVKVMRPDVASTFRRDLRLFRRMVRFFGLFGLFRRYRLNEGLVEIAAILREETDYQYEAANLRQMRRTLRRHGVHVPRVLRDLSTGRVLVMEEIEGVLMSHYLRVRRNDPEVAARWAAINGIDEHALARRLSITTLRQILEDNEFHGDLHPGNIMLLTENRIALIDFGSVGRLPQQTWTLYRYSLQALATRDYGRATDLMLMMSPNIARANNRLLRADMTRALQEWALTAEFSAGSYADRSMSAMSNAVARVMAQHQVPLSWSIMRVGRSLSTLDASLQTLTPDANFMSMCRAYFRDRQRRGRTLEGRRQAFQNAMLHVSALAGDAEVLLGRGLREQALRLHGMLDRLTNVRITVLTFVQRGLWLTILLLILGGVTDEGLRPLSADDREHFYLSHPMIEFLLRAVPDLHPVWWVLTVLGAIYLLRGVTNVRQSIARLE
ncbi:MAG: AarF/ABC1/UbiB kinase family protein, partial [Rhodospirillales bacterium]|nr:AarF/ABC1/UbiB kinase family protein [Rhodospirillales bacterium]